MLEAVRALPLAGAGVHLEVDREVEAGEVRALPEAGRLHTRASVNEINPTLLMNALFIVTPGCS